MRYRSGRGRGGVVHLGVGFVLERYLWVWGQHLGFGGRGGCGILRNSIHRIWVLIMCDLGIGSEPCFSVYFLIRLRF